MRADLPTAIVRNDYPCGFPENCMEIITYPPQKPYANRIVAPTMLQATSSAASVDRSVAQNVSV